MEMKDHLLKKIEEQKKQGGGAPKTSKPIVISAREKQKKFIESMKTQGIATYFKQASLLELDGKFAEAREVYEKLLLQKDTITNEMGLANWVMLYPALQRTSELTDDSKREKDALVWIRDNLLPENGLYHKYLGALMTPVQDHLKERLKKFDLG